MGAVPLSMVSYRLDALSLAAIAAATLDTCTTYYFLAHDLGVETNPILAPLARHSFLWIPIYLLAKPLLIPAMPDACRSAFAVGYLASGLLLGLKNLGGIYFGKFFLIDYLGFTATVIACAGLGVGAFLFPLIQRNAGRASSIQSVAIALGWTAAFIAVDAAFYLCSILLR